ncbi:hypothetical protein M433DRAFT_136211 [Acidomyces richmondensis BFW]|nr:MAG: hypothetical protein FE78DRAFT_138378 [Acidomyces sp. 'richmondensis']KYG43692.1 hypothetical protein M433DRAFT_136211 [Acidomyces richmondensis BFW]
MRVLLLGGTGNLGSRIIPNLLVHGHSIVAFVRSPERLQVKISPALYSRLTIVTGDGFDSSAVESALRTHECDAVVSAAGNMVPPWREQIMTRLVTSISSAAVRIGKQRGERPLRAWFIGGLGSLEYPGMEGRQMQDLLARWMAEHHRQTETVLRAIPSTDLEWTLLCVGIMRPESESIDVLEEARGHGLSVSARSPPEWEDSWLRQIPIIGVYLNLLAVMPSYTTKLEDVAALIVEKLPLRGRDGYVGELVGMKSRNNRKRSS